MTYVAPSTRTTGELITSAIWNQDITNNILALKNPPSDSVEGDNSTDYTTTSDTFTDVDPDLSLDVATQGGDLYVHFHGGLRLTSHSVYFDLKLNAVRMGGDDGICAVYGTIGAGDAGGVSFTRRLYGLVADDYNIVLQWKVTTGATATLYAGAGTSGGDMHPQFWAREVN